MHVVVPGISPSASEASREALFKLRLQRIVILVGAAFKGADIIEETWGSSASETCAVDEDRSQSVVVVSELSLFQEIAASVPRITHVNHIIPGKRVFPTQVTLI